MMLKLLVALPLFFLSACVSLLPEPGMAPKRIALAPAILEGAPFVDATQSIAVTRPTASQLLNSVRLQVRDLRGDLVLVDQIADVEWQDHLPLMVQRHLVQSLVSSHKFKAVGFEDDSFSRDVILETDIQSFEVVISKDEMYAQVTLSAKLLKAKGRDVIWQKVLSSRSPLKTHTLVAFVEGLTQAYGAVLRQIRKEV